MVEGLLLALFVDRWIGLAYALITFGTVIIVVLMRWYKKRIPQQAPLDQKTHKLSSDLMGMMRGAPLDAKPPQRQNLGRIFTGLICFIAFLTIISGGGAVILALNTPDPMSEASRKVLDMADMGWTSGLATISGLIAGKAL